MSDITVERLSSYASSLSYEELPSEVVHQAKRLMVDSLGCGLGAFTSEPSKGIQDLASIFSGEVAATVLGTGIKTTPDLAAFANGVMVRYLDFNDNYSGKDNAHPSDNIPVIMAAAEAYNSSGRDLITGIILAYEVQSAWVDTFQLQYNGPWDQAVYSSISTSLGAGKVMGLNKEQLTEALRISVVQGPSLHQSRVGSISHWKACSVANSGRNGIFAAMLAERGITGPPAIFDGRHGFFVGVTGGHVDLAPLAGESGNKFPFRIMKSSIKRFPVDFFSQTAIEGALEAREALGIESGKQLRSVTIRTLDIALNALAGDETRWNPKTRETADHSIPYVVACALLFGSVEVAHFDDEVLCNPELHELMKKVKVQGDPECDKGWPEALLNIVTVKTEDGRSYSAKIPWHLGHYKRPMSDKAIEEKFRMLSNGHLTSKQQDVALETIWHLEEVKDLEKFMRLLSAHA